MKKIILVLLCLQVTIVSIAQITDKVLANRYNTEQLVHSSERKKIEENILVFENHKYLASKGDSVAMFNLATCYKVGIGTPINYNTSFFWYNTSFTKGYLPSIVALADCYRLGIGVDLNHTLAYQYYCKAAIANDRKGHYMKGYMQYKGVGCPQNYSSAFNDFIQGAQLGNTGAMYMLGLCYRNGFGIEANPDSAYFWLQKASDLGEQLAIDELENELPETEYLAQDMLESVEALKKLSQQVEYTPYKYTKIRKSNNQLPKNGEYLGYKLKYDYSGSRLIETKPLELSLFIEDNLFTCSWQERGFAELIKMEGKITNHSEFIVNPNLIKWGDYYDIESPMRYSLNALQFEYIEEGSDSYLLGDLALFCIDRKEPERPTKVVLHRLNKEITSKHEAVSNLLIYPNPFNTDVDIEFTVYVPSKVQITMYDNNGKIVYQNQAEQLLAGDYVFPIKIDVPSGIYSISVASEKGIISKTLAKP